MSKESILFSDLFDYSRTTTATYIDQTSGNIISADAESPRYIANGLMMEKAATNILLNSDAPATQTITVTSGIPYTLTSYGTGAGYAFISDGGSGTAPIGTPITFTPSGSSVEISVSGTIDGYQVEFGKLSTSLVITAGTPVNRTTDALSRVFGSEHSTEEGTYFLAFSHNYTDTFGDNLILSNTASKSFMFADEVGEYKAYNGTTEKDYPSVQTSGEIEKLAISIKAGEWILARNGSSTAFVIGSDTLLDETTIKFFEVASGAVAKFEYWPIAKSASDLESLTL